MGEKGKNRRKKNRNIKGTRKGRNKAESSNNDDEYDN